MGTRGFIGFAIDGQTKVVYNHFDSYPDALGEAVRHWIYQVTETQGALNHARTLAQNLKSVDSEVPPTPEQTQRLLKYAVPGVATQSLDDWYVLLRRTQGEPALILDAGYYEDAKDFPYDSLFAEWGYVVDFDTEVFEVYRGFQHEPHNLGRFADNSRANPGVSGRTYYPVALMVSWAFDKLPDSEDFLTQFQDDDEE